MSVTSLVCVATEFEGRLLSERLAGRTDIRLVRLGVGAVSAAHAVTLAIIEHTPQHVIVCGVGGAYPGSGLSVGDVISADSECYGDLGAASPEGFLDMQALGFPTVAGPNPRYNEFPVQLSLTPRRGRFVTVNTCTGTDEAARGLAARTGGAVENMEGAAVAHVAYLHGVLVGEVRGVSNLVGVRDRSAWRLDDAAMVAQDAVMAWIDQR